MRLGRAKALRLAAPLGGTAALLCALLAATALRAADQAADPAEPAPVTPCCAPPQCLAEIPGPAEEAGYAPYTTRVLAEGIVSYGTEDAASGQWLEVIELCDPRRQMVWSRPLETGGALAPAALQGLFNDLVNGEEAVTLEDIAARLAAAGETTEIRQVGYQSCACQLEGGR